MSYYREIEFKQRQSTIQPISSKRTIAYYLKLLNIKKSMTYDVGNSKNILLCNFRYMYAKLMLLYICISVHKHSKQKLHIKINILSFLQGSLKCKKPHNNNTCFVMKISVLHRTGHPLHSNSNIRNGIYNNY